MEDLGGFYLHLPTLNSASISYIFLPALDYMLPTAQFLLYESEVSLITSGSWLSSSNFLLVFYFPWDGQVVQWCWVNFQYRGVLLVWIIVWQGPTALAVGASGVVWTFFLSSIFLASFSLSVGDGPI